MPAKRHPAKARPAKTARGSTAKPVTARLLLRQVAVVQDDRGLAATTVIGALCEVIASHQPTARRAIATLTGLLDEAGIR